MNEYSLLINLIPPALILSVLAYLTRFFGKIIADQHSVVDDRSWHIELSGTMFMISLSSGILGAVFAIKYPVSFEHWWLQYILLAGVSILYVWLSISNTVTSRKMYSLYEARVAAYTGIKKEIYEFFSKSGKYISVGSISIILFYMATLEYFSGNVVWITIIWTIVFQTLIQLAFDFSLKKLKDVVPVDVYPIDKNQEVIKDAIILKMNDDNLRIRTGDKILILNKSVISKIEMTLPEKMR